MEIRVELRPVKPEAGRADFDVREIVRGRVGKTFRQPRRERDLHARVQVDDNSSRPAIIARGYGKAILSQRRHPLFGLLNVLVRNGHELFSIPHIRSACGGQCIDDATRLGPVEAEALAQRQRSTGAIEGRNTASPARSLDVNMRGSMIVRVNDHAQPIEAENGRQRVFCKTQALRKPIAAADNPRRLGWLPRHAAVVARSDSLRTLTGVMNFVIFLMFFVSSALYALWWVRGRKLVARDRMRAESVHSCGRTDPLRLL